MLGTEYNWLVSLTRRADGVTRASLQGGGLLTLAVAVLCFLWIALHS